VTEKERADACDAGPLQKTTTIGFPRSTSEIATSTASHEFERQQRVNKIRRLIETAGLTAKDFFLTQPPPPDRKDDAYPGWKVRERNRRRIARYMSRCGLTAHDLAPQTTPQTASPQLDMFSVEPSTEPSTDNELVGLAITLPESCPRCGGHDAWIGAGRGPHKASVLCVCNRHLGWLSIATFNFIAETVRQFGRPSEPICVNRKPLTGEADAKSPITTANATKGHHHG
jgi:hypothetical protein